MSEETGWADTKIAVVVRDDLQTWQKLNVTAFLVSGIAATAPAATGEAYEDKSGNRYLPMFAHPVLIYSASGDSLTRVLQRARDRTVVPAIYTEDLFSTSHDAANRAAVRAVAYENLNLVGVAFRADRRVTDKVVKGLGLHP